MKKIDTYFMNYHRQNNPRIHLCHLRHFDNTIVNRIPLQSAVPNRLQRILDLVFPHRVEAHPFAYLWEVFGRPAVARVFANISTGCPTGEVGFIPCKAIEGGHYTTTTVARHERGRCGTEGGGQRKGGCQQIWDAI